jgi:formylglycine-generating enzyme required for sulfatase activity
MIRIKGGEFKMGSEDGEADEKPVHTATVATFDLDATEVTVAAYKACVQSKDCTDPNPGEWSTYYESDPTRPVNYVDLKQSQTYCAKQGKRLPTEEEWEFAARGPKGRTWAWGDTPPVMGDGCWGRLAWLKKEGPCPVGAFPKSDTPDGVHDMSGNLWEWTSSGYSFVYEKPRDTSRGLYRGGSWKDLDAKGTKKDPVLVERAARRWRNMPTVKGPMVGFRCAKDVTG